uniref:Uncharacterized protein n=1 Tax=Oryza brachyantha TaxID=4533 RepID=J3LNW5_ORYBR
MAYHAGSVTGQPKPKVVFVLGATATGKSKLAIFIAKRFGGEVINSDKIQVHEGFPIITNKVAKIGRLSTLDGWDVRRVDATAVFTRMAEGAPHGETWEAAVWKPCEATVISPIDFSWFFQCDFYGHGGKTSFSHSSGLE